MKFTSLSISIDRNGNKTLRVKPMAARGFSIQTNGNLPDTHRNGITRATPDEVGDYIKNHGTNAQRAAIL